MLLMSMPCPVEVVIGPAAETDMPASRTVGILPWPHALLNLHEGHRENIKGNPEKALHG